jgi:hypothetical protein
MQIRSYLALAACAIALQASTTASATTLTEAQCTTVRSQFELYKVQILAWAGSNPLRIKIANVGIKVAKSYVDKVCPAVVNETRIFECNINTEDFTATFPLGLNSSGGLVADASATQIVCVNSNACSDIAAQKFNLSSLIATPRCAIGSADPSIVRLSNDELQSRVNLVP